jgi:gliding motility-associated-like protein
VAPKPEASFVPSPYEVSMYYPTVHFTNTSQNSITYSWDFADGQTSTVTHPDHTFPQIAANYTVILVAYNSAGCTDTARVNVKVKDEVIYYIPNSFTPNGDESNNTFQPVFTSGFDPYKFKFEIFNRWGETVFESHDASVGWDGTYHENTVREGNYIWKIEFRERDTDKKYTLSGSLTLIR